MSSFLSVFFELSTDLLCVMDTKGHILEVNQAWEHSLAWQAADLIGRPFASLVHHDDGRRLVEARHYLKRLGRVIKCECRILSRDGDYRWVSWSAGLLDNATVVFGIGRDISDLKEKLLLFDHMQRVAKIGSWRLTVNNDALRWSEESYRIHGLDPSHSISLADSLAFFSQPHRDHLHKALSECRHKGRPFDLELPLTTHEDLAAGPSCLWVRYMGMPLWEKGGITEIHGIIQDISKSKNTADEVANLKNQYERIITRMEDAVWEVALPEGRLIYASPEQTRNITGYEAEEAYTQTDWWFNIILDEDKGKAIAMQRQVFAEGRAEGSYRIRHKDGSLRWVRTRQSLECDEHGLPLRLHGITADVTHSKENDRLLEIQRATLMHSAKMSSLGQMASGIAHEINNPLAIIQGKANRLQKRLQAINDPNVTKEVLEDVRKIEATSQRIVKIIQGLRSFSRNADQDPMRPVPLQQIVDEVLELCRERFQHRNIPLCVIGKSEQTVACRSPQIAQVLLNLLNNAFDAVEHHAEPWVELRIDEHKERVQVSVEDSGSGIPVDMAEKIMQPFFTTKDTGKGTGLGLSITKGIIEEHGGRLWLDHTAPHTRFIFDLPKSASAAGMLSQPQRSTPLSSSAATSSPQSVPVVLKP